MAGLVRNQLDNDVRALNALVPDEINEIPGIINGPRPIGPSMRYPCTPARQVLHATYTHPAPVPSHMWTEPPPAETEPAPGPAEVARTYVMHCVRVVDGLERANCGDWLSLLMLVLLAHFEQYWALAIIFLFSALAHNGQL